MIQETKYGEVLSIAFQHVLNEENIGNVANYIPELAKVNPEHFGVCFASIDNEEIGFGNWKDKFSIQSIAKVFSLSMAYQLLGDAIWERVGVEPSGNAFNSLIQLETNNGIPRNPFLNGGAMVICDLLMSHSKEPLANFLNFVRSVSCSNDIDYNESISKSEAAVGYRNKALCNFIKSFGNMDNHPDDVLDFYFKMCSIEMSCQQLSKAFLYLTTKDFRTVDGSNVLTISQAKRINAIMQTCGFYDESGEFSFKVGLPGKSGVGGGIVALHPEKYCVAVWSPKLNAKGNSYRGMKFLELFTTGTKLSIF